MNEARARPAAPAGRRQAAVTVAVLVCAASMLGLGAWAFLGPESFARFIDFPPYNEHLIHDAGAFQLGIGVTVLLALWWSDGLLVALTGFAVASGLHTVSHLIDRPLGGRDTDAPSLGLLTVVALVAIYLHRQGRKS
jgi:hypothetical protein